MRTAALVTALLLAACNAEQTEAQTVQVKQATVETRQPNASYQPALPAQTRAPIRTANASGFSRAPPQAEPG